MDLCRLCYSCTYPELHQNIFNEKFDPPLWEIIADISKLEITKDDPYTKIVCVHCFVQLKNLYTFREMMLNTDYRIRNCSIDKKDSIETVLGETFLSSDLQNDHDNEPISDDNKSDNNQNSIRIGINDEISIEETEQSPENQIDLCSPTIKRNVDEFLKEGIQEQPPKIARNDKIENNSDTKASNIQNLKNNPNTNESETNTDKKLFQINVKDTEGIVDCSSTDKIVLQQPLNKDCVNLNESIDENETITGEELYQCGICHETFPQEDILEMHIKSVHSDQKFYKCEICKKNFLTVHQLPSHSEEHAKVDDNLKVCIYENSFSSDESAKKFIYMAYLKTYTKEKLFQCNTCGKQFLSMVTLNNHLAIHKKTYQCDICGKIFAVMQYLQTHLRWHTGEKLYCCNKCGKRFVGRSSLNVHMRLHNGVKPYQCEICGKKFSRNGILHRHLIVHTGEKSHQCNVCCKKFATVRELRKHSTVHTGEQPYCCNTCGKRFSRKDNLNTHSKIHTGEKPFKCNICDKRFLYKHVLRDHLKVHTGEKSFDCNECNVSFLQRSDLSAHMKREHKKK